MNGVGKREEDRNSNSVKTNYHPGLTQSLNLSSPQTLFKYITLNPSFNARVSSFYGYMDKGIEGYDTTYETTSYTLRPPFTDNRYSDTEWPIAKRDTLSTDNYGNPDSIEVTRKKEIITPSRNKHDNSFGSDVDWSTGVSLSTNIYGIFPFKIFNFAGLRHTFSPSIGYSFVPRHDQEKEFYPIGLPFTREQDRKQLLNLSINNQFDGKIISSGKEGEKPAEHKFPILSTSLSTSYDFENDSCKWSDLSLSASTSYKNLSVRYNSSFWLYDQNQKLSLPTMKNMTLTFSTGSLGASGKLWGGDLLVLDSLNPYDPVKYNNAGPQSWSASISPSYTFSMSRANRTEMFTPVKHYNLSASANLNFSRNWSMRWSGAYNFIENQWIQNSISLYCDLECWDMKFEWRPEKLNPGYYFLVNIKKIPEIKWEKRD